MMVDACSSSSLQACQPRSTAAFYRWREARIRARFKLQLQDILQSISSEDTSTQQLQHELGVARAREHDLLHKLSQLKGELTATAGQLLEQQAHAADLQTVIDAYDAQVLAPLAQRLTTAQDSCDAHVQQHQLTHEAHQQALQNLKKENLQLLQEQHQLLNAMAEKDLEVSRLSSEVLAAKEGAAAAQRKLTAMEGVVRATGEQAAAAQDAAHEFSRTVIKMQQELADLKDRYHAALSQLQPLQAAAAESGALRQRLQESSAAAAALAAAQLEHKAALCEAHASLAAATERCRMLDSLQSKSKATQAQATSGADGQQESFASALAQQLEAAQAQLCRLAPQLAAAELTVQQQRRQIEQLAGELQHARAAALVAPEEQVQEAQVVSGDVDWAEVLMQHADQLQQQVDVMQAVLGQAPQQQLPRHTAALSTVAHAAEMLCSTIRLLQQQQQSLPLTHPAAEALTSQVETTVQQLSQQQQLLHSQLRLSLDTEHRQMWQEQVVSVFEEASDALLAARQACSHSTDAGAAEAAGDMLAAVDSLLQELLAAAPDQHSKAAATTDAAAKSEGMPQNDTAAAATAVTHVQDALQEVAGHLAAVVAAHSTATGAAAAVAGSAAAELHKGEIEDLAGSIVAAESLLRETIKPAQVVGSPAGGAAAAGQQVFDAPAVLEQLQPAQAALFAARDSLQQLLGRLAVAMPSGSGSNSHVKQASHRSTSNGVSGNGLVPVELLEATRARLEQAEEQVVALQQEMRKQAVAQQGAATVYVDRTTHLRSRHALSCALLHWQLAAAHGKARELTLQLDDGHTTTQQHSERTSRHAECLAAYLKGKCRAQAAAAQQQLLAAALLAWQQQLALQQGATWRWRWLSQQLLQLHPAASATCTGLCCCNPEEAGPTQQQQQQQQELLAAESTAQSAQHSPEPDSGDVEADAAPALPAVSSSHSNRDELVCCCGSNSYMKRLLRRKRDPQGSVLAAAAAVKLQAAAFKAWHMLAHLQGAVDRVAQAEQQLEALSSGLPAWVELLGSRRRLERAWLGWRLAAVRGAAAQLPQQKQQPQPVSAAAARGQSAAAGGAAGVTGGPSRRGTKQQGLPAAGGVYAGQAQLATQQQQQPLQQQQQQQQQSAGLLGMLAGMPRWQVKVGSAAGLQQAATVGLQDSSSDSEHHAPLLNMAAVAPGAAYATAALQPQQALLLPELLQLQQAGARGAAPVETDAAAQLQQPQSAFSNMPGIVVTHATQGEPGQLGQQQEGVLRGLGVLDATVDEVQVFGQRAQWAVASWEPLQQQQEQQEQKPLQQQQQQQQCTTPSGPELPADSTLLGVPAQQQQQQLQVAPALPASTQGQQEMAPDIDLDHAALAATGDADGLCTAVGPSSKQQPQQLQQRQPRPSSGVASSRAQGTQHQKYSLRDARREAQDGNAKRTVGAAAARVGSGNGGSSSRAASAAATAKDGRKRQMQPPSIAARRPATAAKGPGHKASAATAAVDSMADAGAPADAGMCPEATAAGVAVAGRVCGSLAGIASSLSALQQQVQQRNSVMAPAGGLVLPAAAQGPWVLPLEQQQQQPAAANMQQGVTTSLKPASAAAVNTKPRNAADNSPTRLAGGGARASAAAAAALATASGQQRSSRSSSPVKAAAGHQRSSSPVKVPPAGVRAQLAQYEGKLLQLRSTLQSAALPWTNPTACHDASAAAQCGDGSSAAQDSRGAAGAGGPVVHVGAAPAVTAASLVNQGALAASAAWRAGAAVVLRPRSPEAIQLSSPAVSPAAAATRVPQLQQQWQPQQWPQQQVQPAVGVTAGAPVVPPEWRLEGQPRSSSLVPVVLCQTAAAGDLPVQPQAVHDAGSGADMAVGPPASAAVGLAPAVVVGQATEPGVVRFARLC